ncbi:hypothetical protein D3C72_89710 [compost metagenome]
MAFVEQVLDDLRKQRVAGAFRDDQVEGPVLFDRLSRVGDIVRHRIERCAQCDQRLFRHRCCRLDNDGAFDDGTRLHQFRRAFTQGSAVAGRFCCVEHVDARPHADLDRTVDFERDQRLPKRRA